MKLGTRPRRRRRRRYQGLIIALLCCAFAQALHVAASTSLTVDEGLHIASGYTIWRTGDYRLIEEHPPLVKLWLALPLLPIRDVADPTTLPAWQSAAEPSTESLPLLQMAQQLLYPYHPIDRWLFPARAMSALLSVLLLATITRWSRNSVGVAGSLIALGLASFDPNLLAHAAVAGTDLGATTFITLGLWRATHFLQKPNHRTALETGVLLGLALASKLTAMLLGPALAIAGLARLFTLPREKRLYLARLAALIVLVALGVLWASYGLQIGPLPDGALPVPAPAHLIPIMRLLSHSEGGHQAYLLGNNSMHGWWYYFPVAFLVKTPLPALLLMLGGTLTIAAHTWRLHRSSERNVIPFTTVGLFVATYTITSVLSPLNIGYRHLIPLLPPLYVAAAHIACGLERPHSPAKKVRSLRLVETGLIVALLLAQATTTLAQTPNLLAYFNRAVGGSGEGWRYLADSNTDWGQAYKHLAAYQDANAIEQVNLAAFLFYDPAIYGVDYSPLTPLKGDTPAVFPSRFAPPAGDYAISATPLDGIPTADEAMYDWFRWRTPDAKIGQALFYYHVTAEETETEWLAQCITPTAPLSNGAITAGFGAMPERLLTFDCTKTWIYRSNDAGRGAYVVHGALLEDTLSARLHYETPASIDSFAQSHLQKTAISYWQRAYRNEPAFAIFRSQTQPETHSDIPAVELDGPLTFLRAQATVTDKGYEIATWWAVEQRPDGQPFSIMGHLIAPDGHPLGIDDGLGIAPGDLITGDIIVQRHQFSVSPSDSLVFQTGAYWLDSMVRWSRVSTADLQETEPTDIISIPLGNMQ